jgi:FecR protein
MTFRSHIRVALFAAIGTFFLPVPAIHAQDAGSVRVVRLSRVEGQVLVSHAGSNVWEDATLNLPLQEVDTLATQDGLAGIEFENGATAYLAENSLLQITQLGFSGGGRATDLTLTQGTGNFYANLTNQDTFRVETLTFNVAIPQRAEFRVDGFKDGAAVEVFLGDVSVSTTRGSSNLQKGQSVAVHENDLKDFSIGSLPTAEDAFDQWVTEEGEIIRSGNKNTLSYINSPNVYGLSDLARYGTFVNIAGFGYSWRPFSVGFTWTPYFNGKFILDPMLGWIWVSSEPWGWMPYHFGSWLLSPDLGWVWVPGGPAGLKQWEPSRVDWVNVGNHVGWVAKSPNDRDGAPANAAKGVVVRSSKAPDHGNDSNEIVSGKDLRNIMQLKQPPPEFASRTVPVADRPGVQSTIRLAPRTPDNNQSIAYDSRTHTYINRDGGNQTPPVNLPGARNNPPVAPAAIMPRTNTQTEVPRLMVPPSGTLNSHMQRVILPPPYPTPTAPRGNFPVNGIVPARPQVNLPFNPMPRPFSPPPMAAPPATPGQSAPGAFRVPEPPPAAPRPVTAPPAPPPATPRQEPAQPGTAARPGTQSPEPASPRNPRDRR